MRDVSSKYNTLRTAKASASLSVLPATIQAIKAGNVPKADPLGVARVAGIQAAKNTSLLIPYCHQVPLDFVDVEISLLTDSILVRTEVKAIWKTGVEMEALVAASSTALALYDMLKIIDERMRISSVELTEKRGGKSSLRVTGEGLTAAVLVMSDSVSSGKKQDTSGKILADRLRVLKFDVLQTKVLPDDFAAIEKELRELSDIHHVDIIVSTGGTGVGPRDVTPEATLSIIERRLEGVEKALVNFGQNRLPMAMLSRGIVGVRGKTLIINFPGSPGGVTDGMDAIFPAVLHVFNMMKGEGH